MAQAANPEHQSKFVHDPKYDSAGYLEWTEEMEAVFLRNKGPDGRAVVLLNGRHGQEPLVLVSLARDGTHREWQIRLAVTENQDGTVNYTIIYHYPGERSFGGQASQIMHPRLPITERVTGRVASASEIAERLEAYVRVIDTAAESAFQQARAQSRQFSAQLRAEMMKRKPWWQFWG